MYFLSNGIKDGGKRLYYVSPGNEQLLIIQVIQKTPGKSKF